MANFKNAKTLANAAPSPKGKKKERDVVEIKGVERLVYLDVAIKMLGAAKEKIESAITEKARTRFMRVIKQNGGKPPESFNGIEGLAEINFQLRRRSSNSALNEEELKSLADAKIKATREVITPQLVAINPAYADDKELLKKVERALKKIVPDDFMVLQEEKVKYIISDECLSSVLKSNNAELVKLATTLIAKPLAIEIEPSEIAETVKSIITKPARSKQG